MKLRLLTIPFLFSVFVLARGLDQQPPRIHTPAFIQAHASTSVAVPAPRSVSRTDTTTIWLDDIEGDMSDWELQTGWTVTSSSYSSPTHSLNIDDDNYGLSSAITTPAITLPTLDGSNEFIKFSFDVWCDFPDWDGDGDNFLEDYYRVEVADISDVPIFFHQSTFNAYSGNSWWCGEETLSGYEDGWLQALESPTFTVSGTNPTLTAQIRYELEIYSGAPTNIEGCMINGWDAANVRIQVVGDSAWTVLTGTPAYSYSSCYGWFFNDEDCNIPGWGSSSSGWVPATFDLSSYVGQDVKIRFYMGSDAAYSTPDDPTLTGFYIDDILISNSAGDTLLFDNADDQVVMTPVSGGAYQWEQVFYDYGDITRPGGTGWTTYMPGDPFNGNTQLDLSQYAGDDIKLRFTARIDDNDDGGNGSGLYIDDVHVWKASLGETIPVIQNLVATPGDNVVYLSWEDINAGGGFNGDVIYDDGSFENAIYMTSGTAVMGTYFDAPFGISTVVVNSVDIYGATQAGATTLYGYTVTGGIPDDTPAYSMAITTQTDTWTTHTTGWTFTGDFIIGFEISTSVAVSLDENSVPSLHSWANLGGWDTWANVAAANGLADGEWGIRANVTSTGGLTATYNVYRSVDGGDYEPAVFGFGLTDPYYEDFLAQNGLEHCYQVTVVYDTLEGNPSDEACAVPEAQTVYEMGYDDGVANTSVNVGDANYLAVRFTPDTYPTTIKRLKFYVEGNNGGIAMLQVWDDDGTDGLPGTPWTGGLVVQLAPGWNTKDVSALNLYVGSGDFYVGWQETAQTPPIGIDTDDPIDGRSYINVTGPPPTGTNGEWDLLSTLFEGDFMIRVDVDSANVGVGDGVSSTLPERFGLHQNYPNPFNPRTTITFDLPVRAQTRLTIYDLTGREVMHLVDKALPAGRYQLPVDATNLASGVYLYDLQATSDQGEGFHATRKLVVLK